MRRSDRLTLHAHGLGAAGIPQVKSTHAGLNFATSSCTEQYYRQLDKFTMAPKDAAKSSKGSKYIYASCRVAPRHRDALMKSRQTGTDKIDR